MTMTNVAPATMPERGHAVHPASHTASVPRGTARERHLLFGSVREAPANDNVEAAEAGCDIPMSVVVSIPEDASVPPADSSTSLSPTVAGDDAVVFSAVGTAVAAKWQSVRHRLCICCLQIGETAEPSAPPLQDTSPRVTPLAEATWKQVSGRPARSRSRLPGQLARAAQISVGSSGASAGVGAPEVGAEVDRVIGELDVGLSLGS